MRKAISGGVAALSSVLAAALTWFLLLAAGGVACLVVGVNIILGSGAAFIVAGIAFVICASLIGRGLARA